jgi:hypothetical protein
MRTRTLQRLLLVGVGAVAVALSGSSTHAQSRLPADLRALLPGIDSVSTRDGYLLESSNVPRAGRPTVYAVYEGGGRNGYARAVKHVRWLPGDEVAYRTWLLLPPGFHDRLQGQVDIMRWDNWPSRPRGADWGGVSIWGSDRKARLLRFGATRPEEDVLGEPFELPEGRWLRLEVRQRLSSGPGARSSVWLDGERVADSRAPTTYGAPVDRVRFGIVAIASGDQERPLELFLDTPEGGVTRAAADAWRIAASGVADAVRVIDPRD